jgi:hypothetical protein
MAYGQSLDHIPPILPLVQQKCPILTLAINDATIPAVFRPDEQMLCGGIPVNAPVASTNVCSIGN